MRRNSLAAFQRFRRDLTVLPGHPDKLETSAFSVDASLIKADVDKKKRVPGRPADWRPDLAAASVCLCD